MSVLICYDGSPSAKHAVINAANMLDQSVFPRHDVTLLNVWNEPLPVPTDSSSYKDDPDGPSGDRLIEIAESRAQETINEGRELAMEHGLYAHALIACRESSVPATILRIAQEQDSSLIVLGTHPHGTPGPTLESISAAVVARSPRPVMIIPMSNPDSAAGTGKVDQAAAMSPVPEPVWNA
jgi:nucleotide-binding universal stress UspA family protein